MRDFKKTETGNYFTGGQRECSCRYAGGRKRIYRAAGMFMLLAALCFIMNPGDRIYAGEKEFKECSVAEICSAGQIRETGAGYTEKVTSSYKDKGGTVFYFRFTLDTDAWVYFSGNYSLYSHDGAGTHVDIYSDSAMSSRTGSYGWGYWEHDHEFTGFLGAGTYYAEAVTKQENYQGDFTGNVNITAAAIPVKVLFDFDVEVSSGWKSADVSITDALGSFAKNVQYQKGNVSLNNVYGRKYWKRRLMDDYYSSEPEGAVLLSADSGRYAFQAAANGYYTVMAEDISGSRYSSAVKISGIDDRRPSVSGVKNGKTYKKAVRIKFSDNQSGIKKAELNGKNISSGKKIAADGAYRLAVYDKAGNIRVIRFCIRK